MNQNRNIYRNILFDGARIVGWENESICIEYTNGNKIWYKNGLWHRENGPAVEFRNGDKAWYKNGRYLSEQKFNQRRISDIS